jgi:hypothetical protein
MSEESTTADLVELTREVERVPSRPLDGSPVRAYDRRMATLDPDAFGQPRSADRSPRIADEAAAQPSSGERLGRRAGTWASHTPARRLAPLIVAADGLTAILTRRLRAVVGAVMGSRAFALLLVVGFIALVVLAFVHAINGEPGGPGF